ncbi:hypothetical protein ACFFX0_24050 [Citricoccus parietis]|uniref:Uncharacterized protein n=1 Tax=Citricoccus parietis TaxID=592307 RepID=A0ABV5G574_9MICC
MFPARRPLQLQTAGGHPPGSVRAVDAPVPAGVVLLDGLFCYLDLCGREVIEGHELIPEDIAEHT